MVRRIAFRIGIFFVLGVPLVVESQEQKAQHIPLIMIDPGHGGTAVAGRLSERSNSSPNNAKSPSGILEKDLTLEFSRILRDEIIAEANRQRLKLRVGLTRDDDVNLDFRTRASYCNQPGTVSVVSVHFNAGGGGNAKGSLALISAKERNPNFELDKRFGEGLANACSEGVQRLLPSSKSRGVITDGHLHGGLGSNFFFQLARQPYLREVPKCFLEVEFIDNPEVERALLVKNRAENFRTIALPIASYLVSWVD